LLSSAKAEREARIATLEADAAASDMRIAMLEKQMADLKTKLNTRTIESEDFQALYYDTLEIAKAHGADFSLKNPNPPKRTYFIYGQEAVMRGDKLVRIRHNLDGSIVELQ
jgi:uncharacterized coiled-coil protein SlyX